MEWTLLTAGLAFTTFFAAIAVAFISKRKVDARRDQEDAAKSTLAKDESSTAPPADVDTK
ncbi:hypothetical protein [uncultured Sulfitobacter sp.]|uniref:hypothetical protein n=1 Tax=uncultured Sulfitobacter sp. TaxID=191468 RepID=UPI00262D8756|nr:hypothetical protein [uncultured Sulfitobacter sp.]